MARLVVMIAMIVAATVAEAHPGSVRALRFTGNHRVATAELQAQLDTRAGTTFRPEELERDLFVLSAYYWDHGYANVKIGEPKRELSPDAQTIAIEIPIVEGPTFTVSSVQASGELLDSEDDTLWMLQTRPGMLFSRTKI